MVILTRCLKGECAVLLVTLQSFPIETLLMLESVLNHSLKATFAIT